MEQCGFVCHLVFHTWHRKRLLNDYVFREVISALRDVAEKNNLKILSCCYGSDCIHLVVDFGQSTGNIAECVSLFKSYSSARIRKTLPDLRAFPFFWSRGYSLGLIGDTDAACNYVRCRNSSFSDIPELLTTFKF